MAFVSSRLTQRPLLALGLWRETRTNGRSAQLNLFFYRFCAALRKRHGLRFFARLSFFAFDLSHDNAKLKTLMSIWIFLFFYSPASSRFANVATNEVDVDERALMASCSILLIAVISAHSPMQR